MLLAVFLAVVVVLEAVLNVAGSLLVVVFVGSLREAYFESSYPCSELHWWWCLWK